MVEPDGATVDYDKPRLQISYQTMYCEDTENEILISIICMRTVLLSLTKSAITRYLR